MSSRARLIWSALAGVVAALVTLGVAEAVSIVIAPGSSPLFAVGAFVVGVVLLGESLTLMRVVAALLVVAGLVIFRLAPGGSGH